MIEMFGNSVAYVGASRSDGISTSVLEAMSAGAIPIQTSSSCAAEWFVDGETGFSIHPDRLEEIKVALAKIFDEGFDVETARKHNQEVIRTRANAGALAQIAIESYRAIL
jgi:glycosyltransferase involved in cell wall biosynthesis